MAHPTTKTLTLTALFLVIAYAGYTQSWAFSGKDMGEPAPPLAGVFQHVPYVWETWVILIAPIALTTRLIGAEHLFDTGPSWLFWGLQAIYFYLLAALLTRIGSSSSAA